MRYINHYEQQLAVFQALASDVRIEILELLMAHGRMSMNDLATHLGLTGGALTPHIKRLEACDLVRISQERAAHGNMKMCEPHLEKIFFVFGKSLPSQDEYRSHLRVGQYSAFRVYPTCGLSTSKKILGEVDDPRYFTHQKRFEADILWFSRGYVEYLVPSVLPLDSRIDRFSVSAELSSEAPGSNSDWPSDIHFYLNDVLLCVWTSPGDFGDRPGAFTPGWWYSSWNQYGILKTISVRLDGTYIDGVKVSEVAIGDLDLDPLTPLRFRMAVPDDARHVGGLTIFGRDFGNYNQDIEFRISYHREQAP